VNDLVVGCPVAHRDWVLGLWFDHVERACEVAGVKPRYVFAVDLNDPCWPIIRDRAANVTVMSVPNMKGDDRRVWDQTRYRYMTDLRNLVLRATRDLEPDAFLSIDSDILLHQDHLALMINDLSSYDAVGGKCYMTTTGTKYPSWARLGRDGQLLRSDASGSFRVEVIMALKLMGPNAFAVDYESDPQGEDVGWSKACTRAGVRLGWNGQVCSKHALGPHMLNSVDVRVGF